MTTCTILMQIIALVQYSELSNQSKLQLNLMLGTLLHRYLEVYSTEGGGGAEIYPGVCVYLVPRKTPLRAGYR
jgi:hypothetical protein